MKRLTCFGSLLVCTVLLGFAAPLQAQPSESPILFSVPEADSGDVESLDAIIEALYDVISGAAGEERDWNRMRSLFIPEARMMPLGLREDEGVSIRLLSVGDYIASSGPILEETGFHEQELARRTERFGHMAHVFSTYEGRMETEDTVVRGINSIQLMNDGSRWWIVSVYWQAEGPDNPLPEEYLSE